MILFYFFHRVLINQFLLESVLFNFVLGFEGFDSLFDCDIDLFVCFLKTLRVMSNATYFLYRCVVINSGKCGPLDLSFKRWKLPFIFEPVEDINALWKLLASF